MDPPGSRTTARNQDALPVPSRSHTTGTSSLGDAHPLTDSGEEIPLPEPDHGLGDGPVAFLVEARQEVKEPPANGPKFVLHLSQSRQVGKMDVEFRCALTGPADDPEEGVVGKGVGECLEKDRGGL
jgi:hypothetical protein